MMKAIREIAVTGVCTFLFLIPSMAQAGDYAKFCGDTALEALEGATKLAEAAVKSRKKGCVGPGKDGQAASQNYPDESGKKCVGVHFNHQNGSCGIKKSPGEMLKELGL